MQLGIVGLPNVGKSTIFNAMTKAGADAANYPFCTIDPNVGVVTVEDERLDFLMPIFKSKKRTPAIVEFVDIAGIVRGASKGEGLGNQFLANIRTVDALVHVVRCFDDPNVAHVDGFASPERDISTIEIELILADLAWLERKAERLAKLVKGQDKEAAIELKLVQKISEALEQEIPARNLNYDENETLLLKNQHLLSLKPVLYVANIAEADIGKDDSPHVAAVKKHAAREKAEVIVLSAQIEQEISLLDDEDKALFLEELGLQSPGLDKLIKAGYSLLGLISFFTSGPTEVRAWTIKRNTRAQNAAGKIHSDMERGFIRAEIVAYKDLFQAATYQAAKEKGLVRSEGRDYIMQDGDVTLFRFNV